MSDFDQACHDFTIAMARASQWKHEYHGAAYASRLMQARHDAMQACARLAEALAKDNSEIKHTYPSNYTPGAQQPWSLNVAWEILDRIAPGVISDDARSWLSGAITAKLELAARHGKLNTEAHERSR